MNSRAAKADGGRGLVAESVRGGGGLCRAGRGGAAALLLGCAQVLSERTELPEDVVGPGTGEATARLAVRFIPTSCPSQII